MRKSLLVLLALAVSLSAFAGCGGKEDIESSSSAASATAGVSDPDDDEVLSDILTGPSSEEASQTQSESSRQTGSVKSSSRSGAAAPSVPSVKENEDDKKATLPKLNLTDKNITVCIDWSPASTWVKSWVKALEKTYPGMKITWKQATPDQKAAKLSVWKMSDKMPDAIYVKPEQSWPNLINQNLVQPVDSFIEIQKPFWGSVRETMNGLKINGKHYMLVVNASLMGNVIYQKDVFKNAGIAEDPTSLLFKGQWTWTKFEEYAKKLTKINTSDPSKSRYGIHFQYAEVLFGSTGKDLIGYDTKAKKWVSYLNDPAIKETVEFLTSLGPTGKNYCLVGENDPEAVRDKARSGQVAMYVTAASPGLEFPQEMKKGEMIAVPVPRKPGTDKYYHSAVVDAFCIPVGAKNPLGGVAFANAVRALNIMDLKLDGEIEDFTTDYQDKINKYAESVAVGVPMQFRRISDGEIMKYYTIYGPSFLSGTPYSAVVAKEEPIILEELKKQ